MADIAANITKEAAGYLHMVVATDRHADHISGFGADESGDLIEALQPDVVVQPCTEAPDLATDAAAPKHAMARSPSGLDVRTPISCAASEHPSSTPSWTTADGSPCDRLCGPNQISSCSPRLFEILH